MHFGQHFIICCSRITLSLASRRIKSFKNTEPWFIVLNINVQIIITKHICYPFDQQNKYQINLNDIKAIRQMNVQLQYKFCMGCGSSVAQVSDSIKQGLFKPIRLLEVQREGEATQAEGRMFLFGQTRTQRKILQVQLSNGNVKAVFTRVRIPVPRINYDPIELMYQQSQQIFHLGVYGLSVQPPFNRMLALRLQNNVIFLCGGKDYDGYNIKNQAFYYSIVDQPNIQGQQIELSNRAETRSKYSANRFQKVASMGSRRYGHMGVYVHKIKSVLVFGGINDKEEIVNTCERYGVLDNIWKDFTSMHVAKAFGQCFQFNNKIYVFGGRSSMSKKSKKIEVFDLQTHQWEILPFKIHRGIEDAFVTSPNPNEILIIGGKTNAGPTKSVIKVDLFHQSYVWDSYLSNQYPCVKGTRTRSNVIIFGGVKNTMEIYTNGQWIVKNLDHKKYVEQQQMEIFSFSTQTLNVASIKPQYPGQIKIGKDEIILFGNDDCPCLLICNLKDGRMRKCSISMKCKARSKMGIVEYEKGKYFIAGGCDSKQKKSFNSCYFYDSSTNQTQETVKMSEKKHNFAICALQGFIYVFGGYDSLDKTAKKSCAKFSLVNEGWDLLPSLRRARNKCLAVIINSNTIAVFGGVNSGDTVLGIEIFTISERKFDIYEPTLQVPSNILCSYTIPNNQNSIFILNKAQNQKSVFELTTINLQSKHQQSYTSSLSNHIDAKQLGEPTQKIEIISNRAASQRSVDLTKINQDHIEGDNIIRIKPKLVQIHPKKLESESSQPQLNQSQNKQEINDLDSSFHLEKIDMKNHEIVKVVTEDVQAIEKLEEKKDLILNYQIQKEQPIVIGSNKQLPDEEGFNHNLIDAPSSKLSSCKIQQEYKLISSQPLNWLPDDEFCIVANRFECTYFLTDSYCVELDRNVGRTRRIDFKQSSQVTMSMIK